MNVTEAAYRLVSGRFSLRSEGRLGRGELMDAIEKAFGSAKGAAGALGVSDRSWRRWRSGETRRLKPGHALGLVQAVRRLRLSPARERRLRAAGRAQDAPSWFVHGTFLVSNDERPGKKAWVGRYLSDKKGVDRIGPIVDAFLAGDDEAMTAAFQVASDDYQPGEWITITKVEF